MQFIDIGYNNSPKLQIYRYHLNLITLKFRTKNRLDKSRFVCYTENDTGNVTVTIAGNGT